MKRLDEFIKLSFYFKNYELYKVFIEMKERHLKKLLTLEKRINSIEYFTWEDRKELKKYYEILQKLDLNKKLVENKFSNFNFSKNYLHYIETEYKLLSYEFIISFFKEFLEEKKFIDNKQLINYIYAAEKVINKYFTKNFYLPNDLDKIFSKAVENMLDNYFVKEKIKLVNN